MSWKYSALVLPLLCLTQCTNDGVPMGPAGQPGRRTPEPSKDRGGSGNDDGEPQGPRCDDPASTVVTESLLWKRGAALSNDLQRGLELSADELCSELGQAHCADVHRVPLGQSDPFGTGLFEPTQRPLATTALATDRLVLSACSKRVEKDKTAAPVVFKGLELSDEPMPSAAAEQSALAQAIADLLYPRLLARAAKPEEVEVLRELAADEAGRPVSRSVFAKLSCFAIATTSEFVLY